MGVVLNSSVLLLSVTCSTIVAMWIAGIIATHMLDVNNDRSLDTKESEALATLEVRLRGFADISYGAVAALAAFGQGGTITTQDDGGVPGGAHVHRFERVFGPRLLAYPPNPSGLFLAYNGSISQWYPPNASSIFALGEDINETYCTHSNTTVRMRPVMANGERHVALCLPVDSILTNMSWGYAIVTIAEAGFVNEGDSISTDQFTLSSDGNLLVNSGNLGSNATCNGLQSSVDFELGGEVWDIVLCEIERARYQSRSYVWVVIFIAPVVGVVGAILLFYGLRALYSFLRIHQLRLHAPTGPPVAVAVIGINGAENLWDRYPKLMHHIIRAFEARVAQLRDQHHALQTDATLQHTTNLVFREMHTAVEVCMMLITDLAKNPIRVPNMQYEDGEEEHDDDEAEAIAVVAGTVGFEDVEHQKSAATHMSSSSGGTKMIAITASCVVHWCHRVVLTDHDLLAHWVNCQGQDLLLASKYYHFASPSGVVLSKTAADLGFGTDTKHVIQHFGVITLRGSKEQNSLFYVVHPDYPSVVAPVQRSSSAGGGEQHLLRVRGARSDVTQNNSMWSAQFDPSHRIRVTASEVPHHGASLNPLQTGFSVSASSRPFTDDEAEGHKSDQPPSGSLSGDQGPHVSEGDDTSISGVSAQKLLACNVPAILDRQFVVAFETLAMFNPNLEYSDIKHVIYHYYCAFQTLFRPFAPAERLNLQRRLVTTFGVSQDNFVENLAVRCALRQATEVDNWIALQNKRLAGSTTSDGNQSHDGAPDERASSVSDTHTN